MRITLGQLREAVRGGAKNAASASYMKKERVRERLQAMVAEMVAAGEIKDETELQDAFGAASMALSALKMVPLQVWQKMGG